MKAYCCILLCACLAACAQVAPYQREHMAHHSMRDAEYAGIAEQHIRAVQEGASGTGLDAAGGCGCN